jgi:hypothetical protein
MDDFLASLTGLMFVRKHLHSAFDAKSRRNARLTSTEDVIGHRLYAPGMISAAWIGMLMHEPVNCTFVRAWRKVMPVLPFGLIIAPLWR